MIQIIRAVQTSLACPAQWDCWDSGGNYYYLRFRHGYGEMRQYDTPEWYEDTSWTFDRNGPLPYWKQDPHLIQAFAGFEYGDEYAGDISLEKFAELAGFELNLQAYTDFGNHIRDELIKEGLTFLLDFEHGEENGPGETPAG